MMWVEIGILWMAISVAGCLFFGRFIAAGKRDGLDKPQRDDL